MGALVPLLPYLPNMARCFRPIEDEELENPSDLFALYLEAADGGLFDPAERSRDAFNALAALAKRLDPRAPGERFTTLLRFGAWHLIEPCDSERGRELDLFARGFLTVPEYERVRRHLFERRLYHLLYSQ